MLTQKNFPTINQKRIKTSRTKAKSLFFNAALALIFLTTNACAMNPFKKQLPTTPYALSIDISKKGNKAEIDLRIKSDKERARLEPEKIAFDLKFFWYDPEKDPNSKYYEGFWRRNFGQIGMLKKYFRKYTKEEREEIADDHHRVLNLLDHEELISSGTGATYKSKWIQYKGVPIPNIRITIINLDDADKKIVFDEALEVKKHPNIGGYFDKFLSYIELIPSNYKMIAEVQSDALEFEGTEVLLLIGSQRAWWK